jgi:hypothetical protein
MKKRGFFLCAHDYGHRDDEKDYYPGIEFCKAHGSLVEEEISKAFIFS